MKVSVPDIDEGDEDTEDDDGHSEPSPCCFHCNTESNKESSALPRNGGSGQQRRGDPAHYCSQFTNFKYYPDIIPVKLVKAVKMTPGGPREDQLDRDRGACWLLSSVFNLSLLH